MLTKAPIIAYVPAADVARARKFYEQTLGFKPLSENPGGIVYQGGGGTRFMLYKTQFAGTNKASCAFWEVKDVEAEVKELRAKGVRFEEYDMPGLKTKDGVATDTNGKAAWFKDTEGNILALIQGG